MDFIPNAEMHSFFRRAIRGGVSYIDTHHAFGCDDMQKKKSDFLIYLDVNSLYPTVMTRKLPTGGYQFMGKNSIDSLMVDNQKNIHNYKKKTGFGNVNVSETCLEGEMERGGKERGLSLSPTPQFS